MKPPARPGRVLRIGDFLLGRGRLTSDPNRSSLGLLPSGPDPVGEWLVHRQPPAPYIGPTGRASKRAAGVIHAGLFAASERVPPRPPARHGARASRPRDF